MANQPLNPFDAPAPNFAEPEFAAQHQLLTDSSIPEEQAVIILANIWQANNARDREAWCHDQADQDQAQRDQALAEEEENERRHQAEANLLDTARLEDHKKNKAKYNPIHDVPVPLGPIIIPCASAQFKIKKGGLYCNLWYFTNHGLKAAEKSAMSQDNLDYVTIQRDADDTCVLIVASATDLLLSKSREKKDDAFKPVADEDISWEDFLEATPHIIVSMKDNDWAEDCVQMFINFWTAIHGHPWRHASDHFSQQALCVYQAQ